MQNDAIKSIFFNKLLGSNKLVHVIFVFIQNSCCQQEENIKSKQCDRWGHFAGKPIRQGSMNQVMEQLYALKSV